MVCSELSFLIELLLNHDVPKTTKDLIASRIKEVEVNLTLNQVRPQVVQPQAIHGVPQAASTLALMAKHGDIAPVPMPEMPPIVPVEQIAQTPATAQAMSARANAIAASLNKTVDKTTGRPRKW